jgi:single-stranded-DNA-specific exonuclease
LDCGIKSTALLAYAKELNIDFIICDHHLPDEVLPPAVAILNPKQIGCTYPYKELCGCGIGFKLIGALCMHLNLPNDKAYQYLDLAATAIAADIVPMTWRKPRYCLLWSEEKPMKIPIAASKH